MSLKTSYETTLTLADDVFAALGAPGSAVAAVDEGEVAAVGRGGRRGATRGQSRGRSRGRGGVPRGQAQDGGRAPRPRHPDAVEGCCKQHARYGGRAYMCLDPDRCPMATQLGTPPRQ